MQHPSEDDLALLALGEPVPDAEQHVGACPVCRTELSALSSTVSTARRADLDLPPAPPAVVWQRIVSELGLPADAPSVPAPRSGEAPALRAGLPWRRPLLAAAAALVVVAGAGALVLGLRDAGGPEVTTPLVALGQVSASGQVVLSDREDPRSLLVETSGLPRPDGSYEVWLLDLADDRLVPLGVLDDSGSGRLDVPEGVRVSEYPVVDVSLEPDDGDPAHSGDSVLRGDLPG